MGKKIIFKYKSKIILLVTTFLLSSYNVCAQNATEIITMPESPQIELPEEIKQKQQQRKKEREREEEKEKEKELSQKTKQTTDSIKKTGKQTLIYLERSDLVKFDNENLPDIQVLIGNVILRHDDI
jgi:predicted S18 family serine protease